MVSEGRGGQEPPLSLSARLDRNSSIHFNPLTVAVHDTSVLSRHTRTQSHSVRPGRIAQDSAPALVRKVAKVPRSKVLKHANVSMTREVRSIWHRGIRGVKLRRPHHKFIRRGCPATT